MKHTTFADRAFYIVCIFATVMWITFVVSTSEWAKSRVQNTEAKAR